MGEGVAAKVDLQYFRKLLEGPGMALQQCRECIGQVSSHAKYCPHCGAKVRRTHPLVMVLLVFGALPFLIKILGAGLSGVHDYRGALRESEESTNRYANQMRDLANKLRAYQDAEAKRLAAELDKVATALRAEALDERKRAIELLDSLERQIERYEAQQRRAPANRLVP